MPELPPPRPPMSPEAIVDLRRRVLNNEPVTDEELRHALDSLVVARKTVGTGKPASEPVYVPQGSVTDRFAAFKARQGTDAAGQVQLPHEVKQ